MNRWGILPVRRLSGQIQCSWVGLSFHPARGASRVRWLYPTQQRPQALASWMSTPAICPFPVLNKHFCHSQGIAGVVGIHLLLWVCPTGSQRIPLLQGALPAAHLGVSPAPLLPLHTAALCVSTVLGPISAPPLRRLQGILSSHWTRKTENIWHKLGFTFLVLNLTFSVLSVPLHFLTFLGIKCNPFHLWFWAYASNILLHHVLLITSFNFLGSFTSSPTEASRLPYLQIRMFLQPYFPTSYKFFFSTANIWEQKLLVTNFLFWLPFPPETLSLCPKGVALPGLTQWLPHPHPRAADTSATVHHSYSLPSSSSSGGGWLPVLSPIFSFLHCLVFSAYNFRVSSFSHPILWMTRYVENWNI